MQSRIQPRHPFRMMVLSFVTVLLVAPAHAQQADQAKLIAERNRIEQELQQDVAPLGFHGFADSSL